MTDITERIARTLLVGAHKLEIELNEFTAKILADRAIWVIEHAGIPIDKLLSGEYVAVPVNDWSVTAQFSELSAEKKRAILAMIQAHKARE